MPFTINSLDIKDDEIKVFAKKLLNKLKGNPETQGEFYLRFIEEDTFQKSYDFLKEYVAEEDKKEKDLSKDPEKLPEGKRLSKPAENLKKEILATESLVNALKRASTDENISLEERKKSLTEALNKIENLKYFKDVKPSNPCFDFYKAYKYSLSVDNEMKFISNLFDSLHDVCCTVKNRELTQKFKQFNYDYEALEERDEIIEDDIKKYYEDLIRLGCNNENFDSREKEIKDEIKKYDDELKPLKNGQYKKQKISEIDVKIKEKQDKLDKINKSLKTRKKLIDNINENIKEMEKDQFKKSFNFVVEEYEKAGRERDKRREDLETQRNYYEECQKRVNKAESYKEKLYRFTEQVPQIEEDYKRYQLLQTKGDNLKNSLNSLYMLYEKQVNINSLLSRGADAKYSEEETAWLNEYTRARDYLIKGDFVYKADKDGDKMIELDEKYFKEIEKDSKDAVKTLVENMSRHFDKFLMEYAEERGDIEEKYRSRNNMKMFTDYGELYDLYEKESQSYKDTANAEAVNNELQKAANLSKEKLESKKKDYLKKIADEGKKVDISNEENKLMTYDELLSNAKKHRDKLTEEYDKIVNSSNYISLEKENLKKSKEEYSKEKIKNKIAAIKAKQDAAKDTLKQIETIQKTKGDIKDNLVENANAKRKIRRDYLNLVNDSQENAFYKKLLNIQEHLMDGSSKARKENIENNSQEFQNMKNSLDNAVNALKPSSSLSTEDKKIAVKLLLINANEYYNAKKKQHIPNCFASKQRFARLECTKSILSIDTIQKEIEKENIEEEATAKKHLRNPETKFFEEDKIDEEFKEYLDKKKNIIYGEKETEEKNKGKNTQENILDISFS